MQESSHRPQSAFTIVELLIVIVVIAILAAISVVAYTGVQSRAYKSAIQTDFASITKKMELYRVEKGGWPGPVDSELEAARIDSVSRSVYETSHSNLLYCGNSATNSFSLIAKAKDGKTYVGGSNASFGEYATELTGSNYAQICTDTIGTNNSVARHGYTPAAGWRTWTQSPGPIGG